ncbi:MAG: MutS-related protein [Bacillota bacterium]
MRDPQQTYERRQKAYERLRDKQRRTAARLSNYRLGTFILGAAAFLYLYRAFSAMASLMAAAVALVLFACLAVQHGRVRTHLRHTETLIDLNRRGIGRLTGAWVACADTGAEFADEGHPFASDLDLFGEASFFQWISSAQTPLGREALANVLKNPLHEPPEIRARQEAVMELASRLAWRQQFEAEGILLREKCMSAQQLLSWAKEGHGAYTRASIRLGLRLLPAVTILMLLLYTAERLVPWQMPALLAAVQFVLLAIGGRERSRALSTVYRHEAGLRSYAEMLRQFEEQRFHAPWLIKRQERLKSKDGQAAGEQIRRLSKVAELISNRENALFFFINVLTLWDYQCMIALEDWKRKSGRLLGTWLGVLAEVETISSLANIRFDHPEWAIPSIKEDHAPFRGVSGLCAQQLGHPLIIANRVSNDFEIKAPTRIALITGSNMSGKSTFLRTVGVNLVMAAVGAPVCAEQLSFTPMELWTCMRVSDNLEQSISSFYAEVLKVKRIVDAAKTGNPVFFLLDEIFKGTNSYDRHQGAKALVNQLLKDGAFGLVSTHDLELGDLEYESNGRVRNYHFREHYENEQIRFDYRLRRGVSTTRNALFLIKLAGIELDE